MGETFFQPVGNLLAVHFPNTDLIAWSLLVEAGTMLLAGAAGVGKSMLAIELAYDKLQGRIRSVQSVYGETDGVFLASPIEYTLPSREEHLIEALQERSIEVVVIDPMYLMLEGSEL